MAWQFLSTATQFLLATDACLNQGVATGPPVSISAWFYTNATASQIMLSLATSTATNGAAFVIGVAGNGLVTAQAQSGGVIFSGATSPNNAPAGQWNHVGARFRDGTNRDVVLNGSSDATVASAVTAPTVLTHVLVGWSQLRVQPFNGKMADVAIWNDTLTLQELRWLAKGNSPLQLRSRRRSLKFYRKFENRSYNERQDFNPYTNLKDTTGTRGGAPNPTRHSHPVMVWAWLSQGAAQTLLTLTAAVTVVATVIKSIGANDVAGAVSSASIVRSASLNEKTTAVGITGDVLSVGKLLAANAVGTATLSFSHVINLTLAAAATVIATVTLQVGKLTTAASSALASILKSAGLNETTTVVGVTGDTLNVGKLLSAQATGTATVSFFKLFLMLLTTSATVVASKTIQVGKNAVSTVTAVASIANSAAITFGATVVAVTGRTLQVGKGLAADVSAASSVGIGHFLTLAAQVTVVATLVVKFIPFTPGTTSRQLLMGLIRGLGKIGKGY